jgi:hypothetical protein
MASYIKASLERSYAESFLKELERNENQYFFFIAKATPWVNDNSPPTYTDTDSSEYDVMNNIIAYKKLSPEKILFALPRITWTSGTIYDQYSDTVELFNENNPKEFYVVTDDNNIYKCIKAGTGPSTVKPVQTFTEQFTLSDGYTWKYIATAREGDLPYELTDYIPIDYASLSTDTETVNQYNTQLTSVAGSLTRVETSNFGSGVSWGVYPKTVARTISTGAAVLDVSAYDRDTKILTITDSSSTAKITGNASDYVGYIVRVEKCEPNPTQVNNYAVIKSVSGIGTSTVTISLQNDVIDFHLEPSNAGKITSIEILPHVKIYGNGRDAYGFVAVNTSKQITAFNLVGKGKDYSRVVAEVVSAKTATTVHPTMTPVLSPKGGHGNNILNELNVKDVIVVIDINEFDTEAFVPGGSYRQFGIIKNPVLSDGTKRLAGTEAPFFRDISLRGEELTSYDAILENIFTGDSSNVLVGSESYSSAKVVSVKSRQDPVLVKTQNSSSDFFTYQDRKNRFRLVLDRPVQFFEGETVRQSIPAGTEFGYGDVTGISYGFDITSSGSVVSIVGTTLSVELQSDYGFVPGTIDLVGDSSGLTADIVRIFPAYGEYVWILNNQPGSPTVYNFGTNFDKNFFRVVDVGSAYFDTDRTPSYRGLHRLVIATSASGHTGAVDITSAALTRNAFAEGDTVVQGVTGTNADYAYGTVYNWELINPSCGFLYLTNVTGKFKGVFGSVGTQAYGLTGTTLGQYIVSSVDPPEILPTSGEVLYINNVRPIQRSAGQKEEFRLRLGF